MCPLNLRRAFQPATIHRVLLPLCGPDGSIVACPIFQMSQDLLSRRRRLDILGCPVHGRPGNPEFSRERCFRLPRQHAPLNLLHLLRAKSRLAAFVLSAFLANAIPSAWRPRIMARSISAKEPKISSIKSARGSLVFFANARFSCRKVTVTPLPVSTSTIPRKSASERARRSIDDTTSSSPSRTYAMHSPSPGRAVLVRPEILSSKNRSILLQFASSSF